MDEKELLKIIQKGESEKAEFKETLKLLDEIGETISAFSNSDSGIILIGVSDAGKVIGATIGKNTIEELANYIKRNTDPQVYTSIKVEDLEGKKIILVDVQQSKEKPVFFKRHAYGRVGKTNLGLSSSEMRRLAKESGEKVYWDERVCEGASLDDIDENKIREFVKEAKTQRGLDLPETPPMKEILMKLKLLRDGRLTNAAILLFGKIPQDFFPSAEIKCVRFKGKNVTEPMLDMKIISGDIISQVTEMEKFIFDHIKLESWIEEGKLQRQEKWEYPPKAIREAAVNAVCHRNYVSQSNGQIRIFDDRLEVWNPGSLPAGWTVETLKHEHESKPPNPLVSKQFFWIKYVEDVGSGTNKIIAWCKEWGLPEPVFEFTGTSIVVNIRKPLAKEELLKLGLSERQIKAIEHAEKSGSITNRHYQELNDVSKWTAIRDLADLVEKGVFTTAGKGRELKYILVQNAP